MSQSFSADRRGLTPAIGKALEVGVVVLFVGVVSTALYGGFVPSYRAAVGDEVADRTVVTAAEEVENAIPPAAQRVRAVHRVDLPRSIRGSTYRIDADNGSLVLDHPESAVGARTRLALPDRVDRVEGAWQSGGDPMVVVERSPSGLVVRLTDASDLDDSLPGDDGGDEPTGDVEQEGEFE